MDLRMQEKTERRDNLIFEEEQRLTQAEIRKVEFYLFGRDEKNGE